MISVYVLERADGAALYVGMTGDIARRLADHESARPWWREVVRISHEVCVDAVAGERRERELIRELQPVHNVLRPAPGTRAVPAEVAVVSIRAEQAKLDEFKAVAAANRRSVSQQMRWLIDKAIDEHKAAA